MPTIEIKFCEFCQRNYSYNTSLHLNGFCASCQPYSYGKLVELFQEVYQENQAKITQLSQDLTTEQQTHQDAIRTAQE
jgi:hypothetical protein